MSKNLIERIGKEKFINEMEKSNSFTELCKNVNAGYRYVVLALSKLNLLDSFKQKIQHYKKQNYKNIFKDTLKYRYYDNITHTYKTDYKKWCTLFFNNQITLNHAATIKRNLINAGYKENKCQCCGISKWNNKLITLQLHHIDGNKTNNALQNLQLLCPNCHSQTDNYGSKNASKKECKRKKKSTAKKEIKTLTFNNKTLSISQWSMELDIPINTIYHRIKAGKTIEKILAIKK